MRCLLVALVALSVTFPAFGQQQSIKERAAELVDKAQNLEAQGDFAAAATEYRAAYKLVPHPVLLFNLAQVYRQEGDKVRAYHFYQKYLIIEPNGKLSELARRFVEELTTELGAPIPKPPSDDDILVQQAKPQRPPEPKPVITPPPKPPIVVEAPPPRSRHFTPATWAFAGVSIAALGVGSYFAFTSYADYGDCEDRGTCDTNDEVDGIRRRAIAGDILLGVSLASAVTAGILYWRSDGEEPAVTASVGADGASLSWSTRF